MTDDIGTTGAAAEEILVLAQSHRTFAETYDLARERFEKARENLDMLAAQKLARTAQDHFPGAARIVLIDGDSLDWMGYSHTEDAGGTVLGSSDPEEAQEAMREAAMELDCRGTYWTNVCVGAPEDTAGDAPETVRDRYTALVSRAVIDVERALGFELA